MLITLRLPVFSALRLNLAVTDGNRQEVVTTLTAVELAGRLTLGTGRAISPEAVVRYCVASQAATAALHGLIEKYGEKGLVESLHEACRDLALWVPEQDEATRQWLRHVLEGHFLSSEAGPRAVPEDAHSWAGRQTAERLAEICRMSFPMAYHLCVAAHAASSLPEGEAAREGAPRRSGPSAMERLHGHR